VSLTAFLHHMKRWKP